MIPFQPKKLHHKKRLLVIEQDPLAARGLKDVLESFPEFTPHFIWEIELDSGWRYIKDQDANALLLSIVHISPGAVSFVRQIKGHRPGLMVIVIAGDDRPDWVSELLQAGADSYLHKKLAQEEFDRGLARSLGGERIVAVPDPSGWLLRVLTIAKSRPDRSGRRQSPGGDVPKKP